MRTFKNSKIFVIFCFLIGLFILIPLIVLPQESKDKDGKKAYEEFTKSANKCLAELEKISFAIESGAKPDALLEKVNALILPKNPNDSDLLSLNLMMLSEIYYTNLLTGLKNGGDLKKSNLLQYLQKLAQSSVQTAKVAIENKEIVTINKCALCEGKSFVACYLCQGEGKCTYCSGKGCNVCQKSGLCVGCNGFGKNPCMICSLIRLLVYDNPEIFQSADFKTQVATAKEEKGISANEFSAITGLKILCSQEAIWRQQDADGNGIKDYWTYDISCFNRMTRADGTTKVNFIDTSYARADANRAVDGVFGVTPVIEKWDAGATALVKTAKLGYFYRAMLTDEDGKPYNVNAVGTNSIAATNNSKFAFVAYPETYGTTGINTFIVNQEGTVYVCDCGSDKAKVVLQWPGANPVSVVGPGGRNWKVAD